MSREDNPRYHGLLVEFERLTGYARAASQLGYTVLSANDHMVYSRPHLDSLTSLAVVIETSGQMKLMTSIALLVIRGAAPLAKALAAIDANSLTNIRLHFGDAIDVPDSATRSPPGITLST